MDPIRELRRLFYKLNNMCPDQPTSRSNKKPKHNQTYREGIGCYISMLVLILYIASTVYFLSNRGILFYCILYSHVMLYFVLVENLSDTFCGTWKYQRSQLAH